MSDEATTTVTMETTGHVKWEVPISDVDRESVSLENATEIERKVHGDPMAHIRNDTMEEVEVRE